MAGKITQEADFRNYSKKQSSDSKKEVSGIFETKSRFSKRTKILFAVLLIVAIAQGVYLYVVYSKIKPPTPVGYKYSDGKTGPPKLIPEQK